MKKNWLKWLSLPLAITLTVLFAQRCQMADPSISEPGEIGQVQSEASATTEKGIKVNITFVNVNDGSTQQPYKTGIKLNDPDGMVRTAGGQTQSTVTTDHGLISLALDPDASFPYSFSMDISSPDFVPQTRTIILEDEKSVAVVVKMLSIEEGAPGVSTASQSFSISNGVAANGITLRTQGPSQQLFTIMIPKGTGFLDGAGRAIKGNNLTIMATMYASSSSQAMDAAPAPLLTPNVFGPGGEEPIGNLDQPIPFRSLGMSTVDMWVDGKEVKRFTEPIIFEYELDQESTPGYKGEPLQEGMSVEYWSFDEERDAWIEEGVTMEFTYNEKTRRLVGRAEIIHLSTWNLDYKGTVCPDQSFNFVANPGTYKFEIRSASNGQMVTSFASKNITVGGSGTENVTLRNLPQDLGQLVILVFDSSGNLLEARTFSPCGNFGDIDVTGVSCFNPTNVTVVCSDGASPAGIAIGYTTFAGSATNILGVTDASGQFVACGLLDGSGINLHAFVNSPLTLNGYSWRGNGSNSNITVTTNASGDITITLPCL